MDTASLLDRLGSALAVNCCQFACLMPSPPECDCDVVVDNRDWMARLRADRPGARLRVSEEIGPRAPKRRGSIEVY